jgi:deoxycytidine triphosphate deaminase
MILTAEQIFSLIEAGAVYPSPVTCPEQIESDLLDLTIDTILLVKGKSEAKRYEESVIVGGAKPEVFFGLEKRRVPPQTPLTWNKNSYGNLEATCDPGYPYVFKSAEVFNLPPKVKVQAVNRNSVNRCGGAIEGTFIPYGYQGHIFVRFEIPLYGPRFTWERGAKFCSTAWHAMAGAGKKYEGIWSGDKSCTDGEERAF